MSDIYDMGNKSGAELAAYIQRIITLEEEKAETAERIKAEYAEAAGNGFDKKSIKQLVKDIRADSAKTVEMRAVTETYRRALGALAGSPLGDWARSWMAESERTQQRSTEAASVFNDFMAKARATDKSGDGGDDREDDK